MRIQFNDAADPDNDALGAKPMRSWQMLGAEVMDEYPREIELVLRNADDDELYCRTFLCEDADIKINLLDGENEEGLVKTMNNKIFVVKPGPASCFEELVSLMETGIHKEANIREFIKNFVPEYRYNTAGSQ